MEKLIYIIHASRKSTSFQLALRTTNLLKAFRAIMSLKNQGFKFVYLYTNTPEQAAEELHDYINLDN